LSHAPTFSAIHKTTSLKKHYFVFSYPLSAALTIFLSLLSSIPKITAWLTCATSSITLICHLHVITRNLLFHFLFNLPHSLPSKSFPCQHAPIFTMKTLNPHPHKSKLDRHYHHKIWPPSKQLLNKLSLHRQCIHLPTHDIYHHHPTYISLPIAC
jgi:hypothetical protein